MGRALDSDPWTMAPFHLKLLQVANTRLSGMTWDEIIDRLVLKFFVPPVQYGLQEVKYFYTHYMRETTNALLDMVKVVQPIDKLGYY
jgi:hypothetical protein